MDCLVLKRKKNKLDRSLVLICTNYITKKDVDTHFKWETVFNWYKKESELNNLEKCLISIVNSAIYQERFCFVIQKTNYTQIMADDKNWKTNFEIPNFNNLKNYLTESKIFNKIEETPDLISLQVVDSKLIGLIKNPTEIEQLKELGIKKRRVKEKPWILKRKKAYKEASKVLTKQEKETIKKIYYKSRRISDIVGEKYHVDHIIPISKGGKHHPDNLQIITATENLKKGAKIVK